MKFTKYFFILVSILMLGSCMSSRSVEEKAVLLIDSVVTTYRDSIRNITIIKDSVITKDSTILIVDSMGNVILRDRWHYIYKDRQSSNDLYKSKLDSTSSFEKCDTIYINKVYTKSSKSIFDTFFEKFGKVSIIIIVIIVLFFILKKRFT